MSTAIPISDLLKQELETSLERASHGVRDREAMRKAGEDMNRMREDLRQRIGTVDIAVELVRDARDQ